MPRRKRVPVSSIDWTPVGQFFLWGGVVFVVAVLLGAPLWLGFMFGVYIGIEAAD